MNRRLFGLATLATLLWGCGSAGRDSLNEIRLEGIAKIAVAPFEAPLFFQAGEDWVGSEVEFSNRIVQKINQALANRGESVSAKPFFITRNPDQLLTALRNREVQLVVAALPLDQEASEDVEYSRPYYTTELVLVTRASGGIGMGQMTGRKIGVRQGTRAARLLEESIGADFVVPYPSFTEAALDLRPGIIDGVIEDKHVAAYYLVETPGFQALEIVPDTFAEFVCAVAVTKGDADLLQAVNDVIQEQGREYNEWLGAVLEDRLEQVQQWYVDRLEREKRQDSPRRVTVRILKDRGSSFDHYLLANTAIRFTHSNTNEVARSGRIQFRGRIGTAAVSLKPGEHSIYLEKFGRTVGSIVVDRVNDPEAFTMNFQWDASDNLSIRKVLPQAN